MRLRNRWWHVLPLSLITSLSELFGSHKEKSQQGRGRRARPSLEQLEERTLLAITGIPLWTAQGPGPIVNGITGSTNSFTGAVQAVAEAPSGVVFAGAVNGGVWRYTQEGTETSPSWKPLTDQLPSLSIGALALSPWDSTGLALLTPTTAVSQMVLFAGTGNTSSSHEGSAQGFFLSTDGGANWASDAPQEEAKFKGLNITSIVTGEQNIVLAATNNVDTTKGRGGIYRSADNGRTWEHLSGEAPKQSELAGGEDAADNELPLAGVSDLIRDTNDLTRFYAAVPNQGIYQSTDGGLIWKRIDTGMPSTLIAGMASIRLAVSEAGGHPTLYAAAIGKDPHPSPTDPHPQDIVEWVYRANVTTTPIAWVPIWDAPAHGQPFPTPAPADSLALLAERDANSLFMGTASNFYRWDESVWSQPSPPQNGWEVITDANHGHAELHADSRNMLFDPGQTLLAAPGTNLLEVDDGGIHRLVNPDSAARAWQPLNTNLSTAEFYSVAYDSVNKLLFGGTQDNGSPEQFTSNSPQWLTGYSTNPARPVPAGPGGDGGNVQVDNTNPSYSLHYLTAQYLDEFTRRKVDKGTHDVTDHRIALRVTGTSKPDGTPYTLQDKDPATGRFVVDPTLPFFPKYVLNAADPKRMLIGSTHLYESFDQGDDLEVVGGPMRNNTKFVPRKTFGTITAMAYGWKDASISDPALAQRTAQADVAYVAASKAGRPLLYVRRPQKNPLTNSTAGEDLDKFTAVDLTKILKLKKSVQFLQVVISPTDWQTVYLLDSSNTIWKIGGAGTGPVVKISAPPGPAVSSLEAVYQAGQGSDPGHTVLLVGGLGVVYQATDLGKDTHWNALPGGLPNVKITDLHYYPADNLLVAGTLGRGVWTLGIKPSELDDRSVTGQPAITEDQGPLDVVLTRSPDRKDILEVTVNGGAEHYQMSTLGLLQLTVAGSDLHNTSLRVDLSNGMIDVSRIYYNGGSGVNMLDVVGKVKSVDPSTTPEFPAGDGTVTITGLDKFEQQIIRLYAF
jgi:hypothetical protein